MSTDSLADTIAPKSDQVGADDFLTGARTVTITGVSRGNAEQPVVIDLAGLLPYKPCKSMRRVLIAAWGDRGADWVGRSMTLYADMSVKFGGVAVGGIRISHLSDIAEPFTMMLTTTRSKRSGFTVRPLFYYPPEQFAEKLPAMLKTIADGKMSAAEVIAHCEKTGLLTEQQRALIDGGTQ